MCVSLAEGRACRQNINFVGKCNDAASAIVSGCAHLPVENTLPVHARWVAVQAISRRKKVEKGEMGSFWAGRRKNSGRRSILDSCIQLDPIPLPLSSTAITISSTPRTCCRTEETHGWKQRLFPMQGNRSSFILTQHCQLSPHPMMQHGLHWQA